MHHMLPITNKKFTPKISILYFVMFISHFDYVHIMHHALVNHDGWKHISVGQKLNPRRLKTRIVWQVNKKVGDT
jgi:hypothetical protein